MITTIDQLYAAINPLPAMLSAKGKVLPEVQVQIEANANIRVFLRWRKVGALSDWDKDIEIFSSNSAEEAIDQAVEFIDALPSAAEARLRDFQKQLAKLIDNGRDLGIEVGYMNPLIETMKQLSKNIITDQRPMSERIPPASKGDDDDIPF